MDVRVRVCPRQTRTANGVFEHLATFKGVHHSPVMSEGVCVCPAMSEGVYGHPATSKDIYNCLAISEVVHEDPKGPIVLLKRPGDPQLSTKTLTYLKQSPCQSHYTVEAH